MCYGTFQKEMFWHVDPHSKTTIMLSVSEPPSYSVRVSDWMSDRFKAFSKRLLPTQHSDPTRIDHIHKPSKTPHFKCFADRFEGSFISAFNLYASSKSQWIGSCVFLLEQTSGKFGGAVISLALYRLFPPGQLCADAKLLVAR